MPFNRSTLPIFTGSLLIRNKATRVTQMLFSKGKHLTCTQNWHEVLSSRISYARIDVKLCTILSESVVVNDFCLSTIE